MKRYILGREENELKLDIKEHYDKIYRYCYFKVKQKELAEDITQETFLRFLQSSTYSENGKELHYLYTIARNLCVDSFRAPTMLQVEENKFDLNMKENMENQVTDSILIKECLNKLDQMDCELLLLRIVNQVPIKVLCDFYDVSRFSLYRRLNRVTKELKQYLSEEDFYG